VIHEKHKEWLAKRGIRSDIAETLGVQTSRDSIGNWLVFPYRLKGEVVNRKWRLTSEKQHRMDKGGKLVLWNAEVLRSKQVETGASVVITEGEFDALIAIQCGWHNTVSVPNGAPAEHALDPANSNRYAFLYETKEELQQVQSFILATDGDGPGQMLAQDLSSILGPERCKFVVYPDGCKDLNDVFEIYGEASVTSLLSNAKPWPVKGLYSFSDFPDQAPVQGIPTGIEALNDLIEIVPGTMTVFTGYANMGKSTVLNTIVANCMSRDVKCCVASFETMPKPILRDGLAKALIGCSDNDYWRHPQRLLAWETIESHVKIVSNALDEEMEFDLEDFLDTVRVAVVRDGVKMVILDPWNELEHKRTKDETATEYIGRAIRKIKSFARRYNVAFWVVAHPTKPAKGVNAMPSLYDVSDSANWSNKADYGLVYHRPDKSANAGQLATVKVRMGLPGRCDKVDVYFDHRVSRIVGS
jgi:twinkle protein